MAEKPKYQFKNVQLLKDQSLGIGSYGAVCKAKCDDLLCAAKIIHPTLFDPTALQQIAPQREHRLPIRRFEQECEFMSAIRHPNIVQYLGMFRDTETRLPVLLMELMDDSLTHFLESSTQPIPYHIQINICHDVTLALLFLHSNNIVHRDLSSNNVLLISNIRTKVTDFGMARLGDINLQATNFTNTMCPGTDVYMPPEAVQDKPVYTEKIDCFSFGVIIVQILTRQFPKPGDRLQEIELNHPGIQAGTVLVRVPEVERRQNHISQIDPNHSLLPVALDCLKDKDSERPSAHQLCERVADLKGMPEYLDSARTIQDKDEEIQSLTTGMEEKDHAISSKEEEIQQMRQQLQERDQANRQLEERVRQLKQQLRQLQQESDQALGEYRTQLQEKERQLGRVNQQLEASEQVVAQFERQTAELKLPSHFQSQTSPGNPHSQASGQGPQLMNLEIQQTGSKNSSDCQNKTESSSGLSTSPAKRNLSIPDSSTPTFVIPSPTAQSQPSLLQNSEAAAVNGTENSGKADKSLDVGQTLAAKIDDLRISRLMQKKKKGLAYSVDPVEYSAVEIASKYQDPFGMSYAENREERTGHGHDFQATSIPHNKPEYCDHCGDIAWGLYRQVLRCSKCDFVVHRKCEQKVVIDCSSRLESDLLSQHKQVEDVERIAAEEGKDLPSELARKIREYNRKTTPVHHMHIKTSSSLQHNDPSTIEYQGFIRVYMCVQQPIHVSTAITRTTWYRLMRPIKEQSSEEAGIETAFYLPTDTIRLVHISNLTTTKELVQILLRKSCVTDNPKKFSLYVEYEEDCRRLFEEDHPLEIVLDASCSHRSSKLVLRDNTYSTTQ